MTKEKKLLPPHQIRADINPKTIDVEKRTVELIWSTGYKGLRNSFWSGKYFEELSMQKDHVKMQRLQSGTAPLLNNHDSFNIGAVIGIVERADILDGKTGTAMVRFSSDEEADKIFKKVQEGILRNISIGYNVNKYEDITGPDEKIKTYRAIDWTPVEISVVPIGFDPEARIRQNDELNMCEVEVIEQQRTLTQKEAEMPQDNQPKDQPVQPTVDTEALERKAVEAERTRSSNIRKAVKEAGLDESIAEDMVNRGLPFDEAQKNIAVFSASLKKSKETTVDNSTRVEIGIDDKEKKTSAIIEASLHRSSPGDFKLTQGNYFASYDLLRMMEAIIPRPAGESRSTYAKRVMSSSDLPFILANVGEKSALARYQLYPRTWNRWAQTKTLRNYKQNDLVRSGDFSSLDLKPEGSEYTLGSFGEEREQVQLQTYGKKMAFTREMLVNDDLDMINQVMSEGGVAAARLENRLVYAILTSNPDMGDGNPLFDSTHANIGTAGPVSDVTIGEAFKLMKQQTSVDGLDKLNLNPQYLICGPSEEVAARKYLAVISPTEATNVNVFSGALELIVDGEISNNDYFFACNASQAPTISLFKLQGEENPVIESRFDFNTDNIELKIRHSAVAKALDWRGLVRNLNS